MIGRKSMGNVIWCNGDKKVIGSSIDKAVSEDFYLKKVKGIKSNCPKIPIE